MIINEKNSKFFVGIRVFDEEGKSIEAVEEIDTDTLACRCASLNRVVVAAGFVIIPFPALYARLPDGLFPFVCPIENPSEDQIQQFIQQLLVQRKKYKDSKFDWKNTGNNPFSHGMDNDDSLVQADE